MKEKLIDYYLTLNKNLQAQEKKKNLYFFQLENVRNFYINGICKHQTEW